MNSRLRRYAGPLAAALLLAAPGLAAAEPLQGNIIANEGNKIVVRTGGGDTTVMLTSSTRIQAVSGIFGGQREDHPSSDLIRGLAVEIEALPNGSELDAESITFKPSDLKTARAIQAGIEQPRQRLTAAQAENERRFSQVGQFSEKGRVQIYFDTGSATISAKGKDDLQAFAHQATATPGYALRVVGHTDSTGSAATNPRLSQQRASAVTAYLVRTLNIPPERIMSPAGLGSDVTAVDNTASPNNAMSRRVTVSMLVSKASEGTSSIPPAPR
jgi:outer membrane protein OmpA-like peptidoglycan-associated protein